MTTITEIIARLGHASGLPWAKRPGARACMTCGDRLRAVPHHPYMNSDQWDAVKKGDWFCERGHYFRDPLPPRPLPPTLAEWQAEHEREHPGEPGPVASWTSEDGRVSWLVLDHMVQVDVGDLRCRHFAVGGIVLSGDGTGRATAADLTELARLVAAADGGGG